MPLINDVKALCDRLAPLGWRQLVLDITAGALDIQQPTPAALKQALTKDLQTIDRSHEGFQDFALAGKRGITAAQPAQSLLYHALASPLVTRDKQGTLLAGFASPAELELLENYVFSLAPVDLTRFIAANGGPSKVALVVYAAEYRPAADSVDGRQADLVFSRTGVSRVGTSRARYRAETRGFWPEDEDNPTSIRVVPAKFSLWLAVKKKGSAARILPTVGEPDGDANLDFWIPVHKIFSGSECVTGRDLVVAFTRRLLNLKIQKVHAFLGTQPLPKGYPYVLQDAEIASLEDDGSFGPGWLVPTVYPSLIAPAMKNGKPVTYRVRKELVDGFAAVSPGGGRGFPEYVHARTRVTDGAFEDLNAHLDVKAEMQKKDYDALHYVDFTGEGWINATISGLADTALPLVSAYALVSAPDFFPASGQFELSKWSQSAQVPPTFRNSLWNISPKPLSTARIPANLNLPGSPFKKTDTTVTAVVSMGVPEGVVNPWPVQADALRVSALPDDAAGIFAPGWDVGKASKNGTEHLAAYALGSPFPEDAKLCAALSTFWPAVAPDVFRTFVKLIFNATVNGTIAPLTDAEIGQSGTLPWDGIAGPMVVEAAGQKFVEYPVFLNADYVQGALQNRFSMRMTARLSADQYQERIIASCRAYSVLANLGSLRIARKNWLMLSFVETSPGDVELQQAQNQAGLVLQGQVFAIKMCRITDATQRIDARTERMPLVDLTEFFVSAKDVFVIAKASGASRFSRARSEP